MSIREDGDLQFRFCVIGKKDEMKDFMRLMYFISECGRFGHTGSLELVVNGDGTRVTIFDEADQRLLLPVDDAEKLLENMEGCRFSIGE